MRTIVFGSPEYKDPYTNVACFTTGEQSTLVQVMAWCLMAPSHYLDQCWPNVDGIIHEKMWVPGPRNLTRLITWYHLCSTNAQLLLIRAGNVWGHYAHTIHLISSLAPHWQKVQTTCMIFKLIIQNSSLGSYCDIALIWMPKNLTYKKSLMAWCHQAPSMLIQMYVTIWHH